MLITIRQERRNQTMDTNLQLRIGTGSGTLLSVLGSLSLGDAIATVILAALGAAVSFIVTLLLQRWQGRRNR